MKGAPLLGVDVGGTRIKAGLVDRSGRVLAQRVHWLDGADRTEDGVIARINELVDLLEFGREVGAEVRFIEYMDVGGATHWSQGAVVAQVEILARLEAFYGPIEREEGRGAQPAARFRLGDGTRFGIVASVTEPFCGACDRSRLTADGLWYLCLYAQQGIDLKPWLREGQEDLLAKLQAGWGARADRSAEERRDDPQRGALYQVADLQADPHREMHTRGG